MAVGPSPTLDDALAAVAAGQHRDPFAVLGPHIDENGATVIRALHPAAQSVELRLVATGALQPMIRRKKAGVFEAVVPGAGASVPDYRLRFTFPDDRVIELDDP